jgi:hypothetical protein
MFKKIGILFVLLLSLVLTSCVSSLSLVKDDLPPEYIKKEYNEFSMQLFEYSEGIMGYMIESVKVSIKEDTETSDAEKKVLLNRIKEYEKFEDGRFFGGVLGNWNAHMGSRTEEPLLRSKLNINFSIVTSNNVSLVQDVFPYGQKIVSTFRGQYGGYSTSIYYRYYWFVKAKMPIDKKHINDKDKPVNLIVTYPNGKTQTYSILKK